MLTIVAFLSMTQTNEVLNQFEKYYREAKTLSVSLKLHVSGREEEGIGQYAYQKPLRQAFRMKMAGMNFEWAQTERAILEIEHSVKLYHEYDPVEQFQSPKGDLSDLPTRSFPVAIAAGSLRAMIPTSASFSQVPAPQGAEPGSTNLFASFSNGRFMVEITALVAKDGRLLRLFTSPQGAAETMGIELLYSGYTVNAAPAKDAFSTKLPLGYMPQVLKAWPDPVNVGMQAPLSKLSSLTGGSSDVMGALGRKPGLVAVVDPDGEPSRMLLSILSGMASKLHAKGAKVALIWTEKRRAADAPRAFPEFYDPKGNPLDRFYAAGAPFIMAVDGRGKIGQIWLGFDPKFTDRYVKEALQAVSAPSRG